MYNSSQFNCLQDYTQRKFRSRRQFTQGQTLRRKQFSFPDIGSPTFPWYVHPKTKCFQMGDKWMVGKHTDTLHDRKQYKTTQKHRGECFSDSQIRFTDNLLVFYLLSIKYKIKMTNRFQAFFFPSILFTFPVCSAFHVNHGLFLQKEVLTASS